MATNRRNKPGDQLSVVCSHPTTPATGKPCRLGPMTGMALIDEGDSITSETTVDFGPAVWAISVRGVDDDGNSAVAAGDALFYVDADIDDGTGFLSKKNAGFFYGIALEAVTSGTTSTIKVKHMPSGPSGEANFGAESITLAMLADVARGSILVGGASNRPVATDANDAGKILVGDDTDLVSVAVSGDATLAASGALTIANDAITAAKIAATPSANGRSPWTRSASPSSPAASTK